MVKVNTRWYWAITAARKPGFWGPISTEARAYSQIARMRRKWPQHGPYRIGSVRRDLKGGFIVRQGAPRRAQEGGARSNRPVSQVWDTLTERQKYAALNGRTRRNSDETEAQWDAEYTKGWDAGIEMLRRDREKAFDWWRRYQDRTGGAGTARESGTSDVIAEHWIVSRQNRGTSKRRVPRRARGNPAVTIRTEKVAALIKRIYGDAINRMARGEVEAGGRAFEELMDLDQNVLPLLPKGQRGRLHAMIRGGIRKLRVTCGMPRAGEPYKWRPNRPRARRNALHLYRPLNRPPGIGAVPKGWVLVERPEMPGFERRTDLPQSRYLFGVIGYEHPLSAEDVTRYELEPLGTSKNPRRKKRAGKRPPFNPRQGVAPYFQMKKGAPYYDSRSGRKVSLPAKRTRVILYWLDAVFDTWIDRRGERNWRAVGARRSHMRRNPPVELRPGSAGERPRGPSIARRPTTRPLRPFQWLERPPAPRATGYRVEVRPPRHRYFHEVYAHDDVDRALAHAVKLARTMPTSTIRVWDFHKMKEVWVGKGPEAKISRWRKKAPKGLVGYEAFMNPTARRKKLEEIAWKAVHSDYKGVKRGIRQIMYLDPRTGATVVASLSRVPLDVLRRIAGYERRTRGNPRIPQYRLNLHKKSERRKREEPPEAFLNPRVKIPRAQIEWLVGNLHVGTPDAKVEAEIRKRTAKWTEGQRKEAVKVALRAHHKNQELVRHFRLNPCRRNPCRTRGHRHSPKRVKRSERFWWVWRGRVVRGAWPITARIPKSADGPFSTKREALSRLPKAPKRGHAGLSGLMTKREAARTMRFS